MRFSFLLAIPNLRSNENGNPGASRRVTPKGMGRGGAWRRTAAATGFLSAVLALASVLPGRAQSPEAAPSPSAYVPAGYRLAWHDEFDGNKLDEKKWWYRTDKKMKSEQKAQNVSVSGGDLILNLTYDPQTNDPKRPYSGSGVISRQAFRYGYYEARFKIPKAQGWHTSFWLMGYKLDGPKHVKTSNQEIDICENESFNPLIYSCNLHRWEPPKKHFGPVAPKHNLPNLSEDFHVWGCEVTPAAISCYFDGKLVKTYDTAPLGGVDLQNIWLTSICSGYTAKNSGGMKPGDHPDSARFDYVRFYEKP